MESSILKIATEGRKYGVELFIIHRFNKYPATR